MATHTRLPTSQFSTPKRRNYGPPSGTIKSPKTESRRSRLGHPPTFWIISDCLSIYNHLKIKGYSVKGTHTIVLAPAPGILISLVYGGAWAQAGFWGLQVM